jgi:hypothetical protein
MHATNTKLGVFRDVIIESDYDPLAPLAYSIRVPTGDILDPLKRDLLKTQVKRGGEKGGGTRGGWWEGNWIAALATAAHELTL